MMAKLLYRGQNQYERSDIVLPDGTHLRLRAGDVLECTSEQAAWLLAQRRYRFAKTDAPAGPAVDAADVIRPS